MMCDVASKIINTWTAVEVLRSYLPFLFFLASYIKHSGRIKYQNTGRQSTHNFEKWKVHKIHKDGNDNPGVFLPPGFKKEYTSP